MLSLHRAGCQFTEQAQ